MSWQEEFSLRGKTALITGGSRGIGRAVAELYAEAGAEVIVSSRKQEALEEVATAIRAKGGKAHAIAAHVGHPEEIDTLLRTLDEKGLQIDILVNNAGINPPVSHGLPDTTIELWDKIMSVNLRGPFFLTAALGKRMVARGGGVIVNMSSITSIQPVPELGVYCIAKSGLNTLTRLFAREFGPGGVRVNAIAAGVIDTAMGKYTTENEENLSHVMMMTPLKRIGAPSEIAAVALFLASELGSFTTGSIVHVDGGMMA